MPNNILDLNEGCKTPQKRGQNIIKDYIETYIKLYLQPYIVFYKY